VLNGWPLYVGLMFVVLPFVLATRQRWDWFLSSPLSSRWACTSSIGHGFMHGPRYWYVVSPLLALLAARGAPGSRCYRAAPLSSGAG
jgi:hypothetical protein